MNDPKLGPLPSDIARLLDTEKSRLPEATDRVERVLGRVRATLAGAAEGGSGGQGEGGSGGHGEGGPTETPRDRPRGGPVPILGAKVGGALAAAVAAGAIAGAAGHARFASAPNPGPVAACVQSGQPPSQPPVVGPAVEAPAPVAVPEKADSSTPKLDAAPAPAPSAGATSGLLARDIDLGRERSLVDMARSALARGSSAAAMSALRDHERAFPNGRLSEERDALWIQVLASSGRHAEAKQRAAAFRTRFPNSMLWPSVEAAVTTGDADALP